jgi:hypothetical protein
MIKILAACDSSQNWARVSKIRSGKKANVVRYFYLYSIYPHLFTGHVAATKKAWEFPK